jgi:hypothetical protein
MNEFPPPSVRKTHLRNATLRLLLDLTRAFLIKIMSVLLQDYYLLGCDDVVLHEASPFRITSHDNFLAFSVLNATPDLQKNKAYLS